MRYFPLFADLQGRRVLVVGGGTVAERKIRLLLDAGACVTVVAPAVTEWIASTAATSAGSGRVVTTGSSIRRSTAGSLTHVVQRFEPAHFDGALFAIAATNDRASMNTSPRPARERNVLVNVVDDGGVVELHRSRHRRSFAAGGRDLDGRRGAGAGAARARASRDRCSTIPSACLQPCSSAGEDASSGGARRWRRAAAITKPWCAARSPHWFGRMTSQRPKQSSSVCSAMPTRAAWVCRAGRSRTG